MPRLAAWTMEGSGTDVSGNGRDFSLAGNLAWTAAGDGYTYGGSVPAARALTATAAQSDSAGPAIFGQTANRTVMGWVRRTNNLVDGWILEMKASGTGVWGILFTSGNVQARGRNAGGVAAAQAAQPVANTWYHVAATYDGSNLRLYLNGALAAGPTALAGPMRTDAAAYHMFDGCGSETRLDDPQVYDEALDAATITSLMGSPPGGTTVSGTATAVLPSPSVIAVGTVTKFGTAAATLPGATATGTGSREVSATGSSILPAVAGTGVGTRTVFGTGQAPLPGIDAELGELLVPAAGWLTAADYADFRATHESIMYDLVRIRHDEHSEGVFDTDLGYAPSTAPAPFYDGKARVQARPVLSRDSQGGSGQPQTVLGYAVAVPVTETDIRPTDLVEVYQSMDPDLIGKVLQVQDVQAATYASARRMSCIEVQERVP